MIQSTNPAQASPVATCAPANSEALILALSSNTVTNGVATTLDGRIFLVLARLDGSDGPRIVEWTPAGVTPFPDAAWNSWKAGQNAARTLVRANALRIGPEGDLWIVDVGAPGFGNPKVAGGPKLVQVNLADNTVRRVYDLGGATSDKSFIDDVRFNEGTAYISDAGSPALIALDLKSGATRRVLEGLPSVTAQTPMTAEGKTLYGTNGQPVFIQADQLEVSPDGRWLYFQSSSGPMSRIETRWMGAEIGDDERAAQVQPFSSTPATGGTAIDADGNLYVSDTNRQHILKITPDGAQTILLHDPRLLWVDAMWIDHDGFLWMPAAQLNRIAPFQDGVSRVDLPVCVYKIPIGIGPPPRDHP